MAFVRRLLTQMDMHDAGAGIKCALRLARHLFWRHRDMMLLGIGQHAIQRAGDDGLVAHAGGFNLEGNRCLR